MIPKLERASFITISKDFLAIADSCASLFFALWHAGGGGRRRTPRHQPIHECIQSDNEFHEIISVNSHILCTFCEMNLYDVSESQKYLVFPLFLSVLRV